MYTKIAKPTGANYTNTNPQGREQYDQASLAYDESIFYDGVDENAFTLVAKPVGGLTIVKGMTSGLLMPLTYSKSHDASSWRHLAKPLS